MGARVWRVSPLLFVPSGIGGIQLSAIPGRWLDSIDRPYFGLHPQGFAVSSAPLATSAFRHHGVGEVQSRFCARARALALHQREVSACPEVGGLSTPAKGSPAAAALPLSRPGRIGEEDIKGFVAPRGGETAAKKIWIGAGQARGRPPYPSGSPESPDREVVEGDGQVPPATGRRASDQTCVPLGEGSVDVVGELDPVGVEG